MEERSDRRTTLLRKNILASFLVKGWAGLVQLLLVPATLLCLGEYKNGIWMTIASFLVWVESFDIGLGNGLRNKLAAHLACGDWAKARECVSSTFLMLVMVIIPVALLLIAVVRYGDLYAWMNVSPALVPDLREVMVMTTLLVSGIFILKLVGNIYQALQLPAVNNALVVAGQTLALVLVFALSQMDSLTDRLWWVALAYTSASLVVYAVAFPITFHRYPALRPSWKEFRWTTVKELFQIGLKFFVIQVAGIVLFASSNFLISRLLTPAQVTPYQVAYRYFSLAMMLFSIVAVPYWSATTDAYARGDVEWIRRSMHKMHLVLLGVAVLLGTMALVANPVYRLWVGAEVEVPMQLSLSMAVYMMIVVFSLSYSYFLNGLNALNLQLLFTVGAALVYIPLAWHLGKVYGTQGVVMALCLVNLPGAVVNMIQYRRIINGRARGLWKPSPIKSNV